MPAVIHRPGGSPNIGNTRVNARPYNPLQPNPVAARVGAAHPPQKKTTV